MASSGSVDFSSTRNEIIRGALRLCSVISTGDTPSSFEINDASEALNQMIKAWQSDGVGLWANQLVTIFLQPGQAKYNLGTASGADHITASFVTTTTTSDEISSSTVIEVTSSSGMTSADNIGIILDSGNIHWDIITSVDSATQITLTSGIISAAASGAIIYSYTNKINRPLSIVEARHKRAGESGVEIPLELLSRTNYMRLSTKDTSGITTQAWYDPQLSLGILTLWPVPDNAKETIRLTILRPLEDFDNSSDAPDFPQEWIRTLKYNLAVEIAPEYDVPLGKIAFLQRKADIYYASSSGWDNEPSSIFPQISEY